MNIDAIAVDIDGTITDIKEDFVTQLWNLYEKQKMQEFLQLS